MSNTFGETASDQASATCAGVTPRRAASRTTPGRLRLIAPDAWRLPFERAWRTT
ncbi:MAG TPA: hypothetical protein VFH23_02965 [Jiangellaceae bacterium]|nr:hypothetical protein [Jiangellaceae bacterium]